MSTALTGAIGWAPQVDRATPGTLGNTKWHPGRMVNLALTELTQQLDQEIGGSLLPGGILKMARWAQGDFECYPRTQEAVGWLFYSLIGKVATTGNAGTGYTHKFPGAATRDNTIPNRWLTLRRITPADDPTDYIGETFLQCKVTQLTLTIGAGAILTARFGFQGLSLGSVIMDPANAGSPWTVATEDSVGVPVAPESNATFSDGSAFDSLQQLTITVANQVQDARQELQVGSYAPRNITMLGRAVSIAGTRFYDDDVMYRKIRYGAAAGVDWDKRIYYGGADLSLVFKTQDTPYGTGVDVQGQIGLTAKRVGWSADPLTMQGGNPMALQITGTVVKGTDSDGEDYQIVLLNDKAAYTWPSSGAAPTVSSRVVAAGTGATHVVVTVNAACEAISDPARGFTLTIDPVGAGAAAEETILNAYFAPNGLTLHLVVAHQFIFGDTATLTYDAETGLIIKTADGAALADFTAAVVANQIPE